MKARKKISHFCSANLTANFGETFKRSTELRDCDDAPMLISRGQTECFDRLAFTFYVIGALPWDADLSPRVLFTHPSDADPAPALGHLLFPGGLQSSTIKFRSYGKLLNYLLVDQLPPTVKLMVHYFPQDRHAPYVFYLKFPVIPLTVPPFCHNLSLDEILHHMSIDSAPQSEIALVIKTKFPFHALFDELFRWFIVADRVYRLPISTFLDDYYLGKVQVTKESQPWFDECRDFFTNIVLFVITLPPPDPGSPFLIDQPPVPRFSWDRPAAEHAFFPLAHTCLDCVVKHLSLPQFLTLFSALLLEKTILFYHKDESVVSQFVLASHYLLRPLLWVCGSISVLPKSLEDLLSAPNPFLLGLVEPVREIGPGAVFVDLIRPDIVLGDRKIQLMPASKALEKSLKPAWKNPEANLGLVLQECNQVVAELIAPVCSSIMTDFTQKDAPQSKFFKDLYLQHFPRDQRTFLDAFTSTQMFEVHLEQECKKRSIDHFGLPPSEPV
jgi:hypothetical protein